MIPVSLKKGIRRHLNDLVHSGLEHVLHTVAKEFSEDDGAIVVTYKVWYVIPDQFDYQDIGAIWDETAMLWVSPDSFTRWDESGARGAHSNWQELASGPSDIRETGIPRPVVCAWIDWMSSHDHWDRLIDYYEGEGEGFLKGYPRGSRKAYRAAKADRRLRSLAPQRPAPRGGIATGMGIVSAEEYREYLNDENLREK
jgi:hypothetical protein